MTDRIDPIDPTIASTTDPSTNPAIKQNATPIIKRALLSVTDKTGLVDFARALQDEFGIEVVSTGGTAKVLADAGIAVVPIEEVTGFPEMLDGRVKTLHPKVHGGLLARRDLAAHLEQAAEHDIGLIDLVVVNLYAFEATVARPDASYDQVIENIDIGGPSMLRSAAKNHAAVTVVCRPQDYDTVLAEMRANAGATSFATRQQLATRVFALTSAYDRAIFDWLSVQLSETDNAAESVVFAEKSAPFPGELYLSLGKVKDLRYGENPHQPAAFYRFSDASADVSFGPALLVSPSTSAVASSDSPPFVLAKAHKLQGKELSYNNYLDLDAAWAAVREFAQPTCVIVKHLTPCGIASASDGDLVAAYRCAFECDTVSAFGGVMAFNRALNRAVVESIFENGQFVEALVAPSVDAAAQELLGEKPSIRVLATGGISAPGGGVDYRSIEGGMLLMRSDAAQEDPSGFTVASKRPPTAAERDGLLFAWKACKSVKSNAILLAQGTATVGIGAGQPNRVNSAELAVRQAGEKSRGAVASSDAFMPFADSLEVLAEAGVTALIQPGGSIRDAEVLAAADAANMAVLFTGHRHFRH
ncbi:MAG: bifunctional phosphoribosylaminoimidazolecarboxamide formyltransferase/inosine monophosphate cyclohydrolase [Coriobacteriales bacterium]|jgi:phosphoribosylaminoimidazolecarboxamide formyltransferase/IMP cyclohydrolase|nr:bifunctional phosphoribosylaminoimidazolecarboxamide formyltransferase/inosine monophosphate cyclohydrolase [Coriobacteriales bacterium]